MLNASDHARVTAAIAEAERASAGEVVVIASEASDRYHDVALHWALATMLGVMALCAASPSLLLGAMAAVHGPWSPEPGASQLLTAQLLLAALAFLLALAVLRSASVRLLLTPPATKARRVRRRAIELFRAGAERRTAGRTGVLLYVSRAERRAEIVADAAIHSKVEPEVWGEAMAAVVSGLNAGRAGEGLEAGVREIGAVLATHLPRSPADATADANEIPDRLITL
ncbi:MAG: FIG004694: Hypothetical protein [uncultured Sphingomonadaceae bacterium]|uniref:TPM domain-containing protein n=1 Tax=uncultured Sphingomonadaceae bacterium TaxID=169976 RepID=A0A6J4S569_9SPHN|nr:MAG: FIG004694: Hypothetical protein [uncultured Sphingomonadaceae bacterium]